MPRWQIGWEECLVVIERDGFRPASNLDKAGPAALRSPAAIGPATPRLPGSGPELSTMLPCRGVPGQWASASEVRLDGIMKLLLTSAGVKNPSIQNALVELLGKPIAESSALCIPTAAYGHPMSGPAGAWRFITGRSPLPMTDLGWKSLGVLELTALPSIDEEVWVPKVREIDALLVSGGDATYLAHWMRQSGLAELLPSLRETAGWG
jgi:hypothetical protein